MPEQQQEPPSRPPLRRHRLVPFTEGTSGAHPALPAGSPPTQPLLPAPVLEAQARLAAEATRIIKEAQPTLDALPAALVALSAPEEAQSALGLVQSMLRVLPGELAAGAEANIEQVDWMFAQLLNAPGEPGLIEQVMLALGGPAAPSAQDQPLPDTAPALEALRRLHRDLVALQSGWDALLDLTLPAEMVFPTIPALPEPPAAPAAPAPRAPTPLPAGLVVAQPGARAGLVRPRAAGFGSVPLRLSLVAVLLLLALGGGGIILARGLMGQGGTPNTAQVIAQLPTQIPPTNTTKPLPTATQTAIPPSPTPRPRATPTAGATSTPTPSPTSSPGPVCASGVHVCVSPTFLLVPCAGKPGVTLQLSNNDTQMQDWQATSSTVSRNTPLVTITPASGKLKPGQTITLTIAANAQGEELTGMVFIAGSWSHLPLMVLVFVCD
jgi:hypothetical protein